MVQPQKVPQIWRVIQARILTNNIHIQYLKQKEMNYSDNQNYKRNKV